MFTSRRLAMLLLGTLFCASAAQGAVTVSPGTAGTHWTLTNTGGKYQITFLAAASSVLHGAYTVDGNGSSSDDIEYIEWDRASNNNITLNVGPNLSSVEAIHAGTTGTLGTRQVTLANLAVQNRLGPESGTVTASHVIQAHQITASIVANGDILSSISTLQPSGGANATLTSVQTVAGDLKGSILNPYGSVEEITVGGSIIATASNPAVNIFARDNLLLLDVAGDVTGAYLGKSTGSVTMRVVSACQTPLNRTSW